jgi:hypothetical protein
VFKETAEQFPLRPVGLTRPTLSTLAIVGGVASDALGLEDRPNDALVLVPRHSRVMQQSNATDDKDQNGR